MDHSFDTKIVKKWRKVRQCFLCYWKIAIWESQEVRKGVYEWQFCESRACMKCSRLIKKHRWDLVDCDGMLYEWAIKEIIDELKLKTHEELELYFDNK
jgi:hypothetical protein